MHYTCKAKEKKQTFLLNSFGRYKKRSFNQNGEYIYKNIIFLKHRSGVKYSSGVKLSVGHRTWGRGELH